MTQKELAKMYGIKERKVGIKDKAKAKEIVDKILKCHKCGSRMEWIIDTNQCVCPNCTYAVGKKESKQLLSISRTLNDKNIKFLENNYAAVLEYEKTLETESAANSATPITE